MREQQPWPTMQISDRVKNIPEALSVYMNDIVYKMKRQGIPVTTLSLGEAYFDLPFYGFEKLDIERGYHYSESQGNPDLRKKITEYYFRQYGAVVDSEKEILISAGSKPIIFMVLQTVLNEGDEVLIHEPAWLSYPEQIKLANGSPRFIPYDCPVSDFENYFTSKTKAVILNNPNNPAGKVYKKEELEQLYKMCRSRGIYIIVDEAYSDFIEKNKFVSMANVVQNKDGIIIVNSLSKNFGISGWRIGYVIAAPEIIYHILKLNQHLITCASTILLFYVTEHFEQMLAVTLPQAKQVTEKRNRLEKYIQNCGIQTMGGSATFYIFLNIKDYAHSSLEFALYLLFRYHISVVPGSAYGKSTERFIRIGVGVESDETLEKAVGIIKRVIDCQEYDEELVRTTMKELGVKPFQ